MHIPDSAISPATSLVTGAAMLPVWYAAGRRLRATLNTRQVPLLSIGAAFCFTIMLFNIPMFGGTTVHPAGGVFLSVMLGPSSAVIGMTVALVIQALFFADGGVVAAGANCFTMALGMPLCGYLVYRLCAAKSPPSSFRRAFAAGVGGYVGLNVAALLTALILGLQPVLNHDGAGRALYFPFGLMVTLAAIMLAHLTVAGLAEAVVTFLAVRYVQALGIPLYGAQGAGRRNGRVELLWVGLGSLVALAPLGLLATGDAWGEWSAEDLAGHAGYLPVGLAAAEETGWKGFSLLPDYLSEHGALAYVGAGVVGIAIIVLVTVLVGRRLVHGNTGEKAVATSRGVSPTVSTGEAPSWLLSSEGAGTAALATRRRRDYLERTLSALAEGARDGLLAEQWARKGGLLQRLDPRIKILALLGFVVVTSLLHHAGVLLLVYAFSLVLGLLSGLPVLLLLRRVWPPVALFAGAVCLPAILSIVTPGPALVVLWLNPYVAVTKPGVAVALLLMLRVATAVSFVVLLYLSTRWDDLLRGLRVLFIPKLFLSILAMTYRYLGVLMQTAASMFVARHSRTVGTLRASDNRRFVGSAMGSLFGKSLTLTDEVHSAMISRGWAGEARTLRPLALGIGDVLWGAAMAVVAVAAFWVEAIWK
jgi:cobalt/nickel transport system permease protein